MCGEIQRGIFLSVNAKDMDVLSDIAHERLGYSKAPVNGVRAASATAISQAGIPEQTIKMSDMPLQSRNESVSAREGSELLLNTMLLTVKDEKGNVRTLYDFNQEGKIEYTPMKQGEHSLFPNKMKTADNMNGVLREAVQTKNMSPFLFSVVQQSFNEDGKLKISPDLLEKMLTRPEEVMDESLLGANATEVQEEKEAFMTVVCGNKDTGYLFHTWEITPQVIKAVQHLDDERKEAFFRYAIQNNLGKDNPEIQEALMSLMPQTMSTQQQPTGERAGSLTGTIGQSANHVNLENDQSGLQYSGYMNTNARN